VEAVGGDSARWSQRAAPAGDPAARTAALGRLIAHDRRLAWDAYLNVRDLGGLRCAGGVIRSGVLVRASTLGLLTTAGSVAIRAHGVRTVIDLRGPDEVTALPNPFGLGLAYRNVRVDGEHTLKLHEHAIAGTMAHQLADLARPGSGLRAALAAIASADPAVVVHCQAGRDRTGIVVALLLAALGVADDDIVADYCASDAELADEYARFRAEHPEVAADMAERQARRAWVIGQLLAAVRTEHGDAERYLNLIGVRSDEIKRLREMLVA
jgi:protein-tyrosine phosphatase